MQRIAYWKRKHRMEIMRVVIQEGGDTGITPIQIYETMATGVQRCVVSKVITVLYKDGFLKRCRSFDDLRVYKYLATGRGYEAYLGPRAMPDIQELAAKLGAPEVEPGE